MAAGSSATYRLFGQDVNASSTLNKISGAARGAASSIGSVATSIGTIAGGIGLANVVQQVGQLGKNAVEAGVATLSANEQAAISFETLLGSAEKAQTFLAQMKAFAKATPFDTTDVISYSKALVGAGLSAGHVIPFLTAWGDASGALGQTQDEFGRTMLAVTQIMNRGAVQSGDLLQITEAGIPIWSIMSRALHKPVSALQDLAQKGELNAKEVLPALEAQMSHDYGGTMAKQGQTLQGLWSNLSDTFKLGMADALVPLEGMMKGGLTSAISGVGVAVAWLASTGVPALITFGQAAWTWIVAVWQAAQPYLDAALAFIQNTLLPDIGQVADFITTYVVPAAETLWNAFAADFFGALWGAVQWGIDNLPTLGQAIQNVAQFLADNKTAVETFASVLGGVYLAYKAVTIATGLWTVAQTALDVVLDANPIGLVVIAIGGLVGGFLYLWKTSIGFRQFFEVMWNTIVAFVGASIKGILGYLQGLINTIGSIASHVPGMGWLSDMAKGASASIDQINAKISSIERNVTVTVEVDTVITSPNSPSFGKPTAGQNMVADLFGKNGIMSGGSGNGGTQRAQQVAGGHSTRTPTGAVSTAWNYLKRQGFTDAAAAGVIGNLMGESGLNPTALGDHGTSYGIAQWHNGRWSNLNAYARSTGGNASSLTTQLGFLMRELGQGAAGNLGALKGSNSINGVVSQMVRLFERPANPGAAINARSPMAQRVYAQMHGKGGTSGGLADLGYSGLAGAGPSSVDKAAAAAAAKAAKAARAAVAKEILHGGTLWKNIHGTSAQVTAELNKIRDSANKAARGAGASIVGAYQGTLVKLSRSHEALNTRLKAANDNLKKLTADRAKYISEQGQAAISAGNVATQADSHFGNIVYQMQQKLAWTTKFASVLADLKAKGLFGSALDQLIQAGPEQGLQAAEEIQAQGKAGIAQVNSLQNALGRAGQKVGTVGGDALYNAGIAAAQGLVKGLQSQEKTLNALMTRLAASMAAALKRALGIHSPSRVFAQIGHFTGHGLIQGLNATAPAVNEAAANLIATASTPMSAARMIPAQAGRGGVTHVWNIQTLDPDTAARKVRGLLTRAEVRGTG